VARSHWARLERLERIALQEEIALQHYALTEKARRVELNRCNVEVALAICTAGNPKIGAALR